MSRIKLKVTGQSYIRLCNVFNKLHETGEMTHCKVFQDLLSYFLRFIFKYDYKRSFISSLPMKGNIVNDESLNCRNASYHSIVCPPVITYFCVSAITLYQEVNNI